MREIKFRAWDGKTMFFNVLAGGYEDTVPSVHIASKGWVNVDPYNLMQFTGLLDKNNKEIYEGDILDLGQTVNGCSSFIVFWDRLNLGWNIKYNAPMNNPRSYEYNLQEFFKIDFNCDEGVEIVGNIYQNPELLTNKDEMKNE
jgi:uncharacterized phage protein (TIGR01671 family)